ncbi:hypothetical protein JIN77_12010 [Verrucomicrobiaceae bacterium R5-34]|nr:hypothetical protein [Verrucomicrobiaceae bacterium R5-34]
MILHLRFLVIGTVLMLSSASNAQMSKIEMAWERSEPEKPVTSGYYYGIIDLPPDFLSQILNEKETSPSSDPFGGGSEDTESALINLSFLAPHVLETSLPKCLPKNHAFRDATKLLAKLGIKVDGKQWALLSSGIAGDNRLYYCLSLTNADIIESIVMNLQHRIPSNFRYHSTLVSVPDQGLINQPWTLTRLKKLSPKVHARHGIVSRSGEPALVKFSKNPRFPRWNKPYHFHSRIQIDATLNENFQFADVRMGYHHTTPSGSPLITFKSPLTAKLDHVHVIDCGIHGESGRNFLLIHRTEEFKGLFEQQNHTINRIHIDEISGDYVLATQSKKRKEEKVIPDQGKPKHLKTKFYRCRTDFTQQLIGILTSPTSDNNPFEKKDLAQRDQFPSRIHAFKKGKYLKASDVVIDLTNHSSTLGLNPQKGESIYYNKTQSVLVVNGILPLQADAVSMLDHITQTPQMVRVNARIVTVDIAAIESPKWNIKTIQTRTPTTLTMFAATSRNGERARSGREMKRVTKTNTKGKETTLQNYEFEFTPTISEYAKTLHIQFEINSRPLRIDQLSIDLNTAITIPDGKPAIIELGHPNSATRTHLLILHADVITPDGSFYRDRFKPLK